MGRAFGTQAIVIGAGIAGLTAAKILSEFFQTVTVLERDSLSGNPVSRTGTPHCKQAHTLLRGGLDALADIFPDFEDELERAGAVRVRSAVDVLIEAPGLDPLPRRDFGFDTLCMTRPLVEFVVRRLVERQSNIVIQSRCRVSQLMPSASRTSVSGVRYDQADGPSVMLEGDFIVDASSRGTLTLDLLDDLGFEKPNETEIAVNIGYASAIFDIPSSSSRDWRGVIHRPASTSGRGGFVFPVEDNKWQVSLCGIHGDHPPDNYVDFIAFAKTLRTPTIYDAIANANPVGAINRYVFPSSIRRRFEKLDKFPGGLLPIGDAICRFNPAFGQGMTVAVQQASVLQRLLTDRVDRSLPMEFLATDFFSSVQEVLAAPWSTAESDFVYEKTKGERPVDFQQRIKFGGALLMVAAEDPEVHLVLNEVNHLLTPPSALRAPHIAEKVSARLAAAV